jgi:hypothetical protein
MLPDIQPVEMTTSAMDMVDAMNQPKDQAPTQDPKLKQRNDEFRARIEASKGYRRKLIPLWSTNVDYRRGKPFTSQPDEDQIAVNLDWALVKAKQAQLFSQVPQARVMHGEDLLPAQTPWAITFQKKLNDIIAEAGIESAMDECLPDCINTAGIGTVLVSYEAIVKDVPLPLTQPIQQQEQPLFQRSWIAGILFSVLAQQTSSGPSTLQEQTLTTPHG